MKPSHSLLRLAALVALLPLAFHASAVRPRPIDCGKARSIQPGWTAKQVTRTLGKPYMLRLSRNEMTFGWVTMDGSDELQVRFDTTINDADSRTVMSVEGTCHGERIEVRRSPAALFSDTEIPGAPRRIDFNGIPFYLGYIAESDKRSMRYVEYVPDGQSLGHWKQMIAVFLHADAKTPESLLDTARQGAEDSGNPHFKQIHVSTTGDEAVAAFPMLRDDSVEYQIALWRTVPGGTMAIVYFSRSYQDEGIDIEAYVASEEARIDDHLAGLKALPSITPPLLGQSGSLTLTEDGTDDGKVLIPATRKARD
ncbi:hypothetical protein [Pseudoxanthomonas koreensis]|uniref:hypothetical protein n=1 Tax=Pseudoxanthomonas koreensis TaxID=266061 RepID=UPI0035A644FF